MVVAEPVVCVGVGQGMFGNRRLQRLEVSPCSPTNFLESEKKQGGFHIALIPRIHS